MQASSSPASKRLQGIADVKDLTDREHGTRLVIECKVGVNPQALLADLYRLTPLEESFGINNLVLVDGQPRTLGLKALLRGLPRPPRTRWSPGARATGCARRRSALHLVDGLLIALIDIDEVVRDHPRVAGRRRGARSSLIEQFGLTDIQAGYVLDMQLRRLVALEVEKLRGRAGRAARDDRRPEPHPRRRRCCCAASRRRAGRGGGRARHARAAPSLIDGDLKALVAAPRRPSDSRSPTTRARSSCRAPGWSPARRCTPTPTTPAGASAPAAAATTSSCRSPASTTRGTVGLITSAGRVLRVGVLDLPSVPAVTTGALSLRGGAPASEFAALQRGERVLGLSALPDGGPGIALATRQGTVKRVAPEWPAKGEAVEIIALRPGDEVVGAAELVDGEEELVLFASTGDLLRFPASAVRPQGRSAGGMAGMKLAAGATLVGFSAVDLKAPEGVLDVVDEPLVVTGGGLPPEGRSRARATVSSVKVTPLSEYPRKGRATGGVRCQRLLTGEALLVLGWAGRGPAWAAAASGDPVELPATYGRRDGSGTPVEKPPVAVGRPHR